MYFILYIIHSKQWRFESYNWIFLFCKNMKCLELYSNKNAIKHWDKQIIDELKYFHICNLQAWINPLVVSIPKVNDLLHFQYLEMLKNLCCNIFHKIHVHTYLSCVAVLRLSITVHIWVLKYLRVTLFFFVLLLLYRKPDMFACIWKIYSGSQV